MNVQYVNLVEHQILVTPLQFLQKLHSNSQIPLKKPKGGSLSKEDKRFNRQLARQRK